MDGVIVFVYVSFSISFVVTIFVAMSKMDKKEREKKSISHGHLVVVGKKEQATDNFITKRRRYEIHTRNRITGEEFTFGVTLYEYNNLILGDSFTYDSLVGIGPRKNIIQSC